MSLYNKYILPKVIDWSCKQGPNMKQRQKIVPLARGRVLEIGIGSGLNLPFYDETKVKHLVAIDPALEIWNKNKVDTDALAFQFEFARAFAENLPFDSNNFDTVVITYTLCSIPLVEQAIEEIRRVLKPNGKLLFCEHGKAPDKKVAQWQNRLNPLWKVIGGGCNLNKDIPLIIAENGLQIEKLETMYIPGWKPASFNYWGSATLM